MRLVANNNENINHINNNNKNNNDLHVGLGLFLEYAISFASLTSGRGEFRCGPSAACHFSNCAHGSRRCHPIITPVGVRRGSSKAAFWAPNRRKIRFFGAPKPNPAPAKSQTGAGVNVGGSISSIASAS